MQCGFNKKVNSWNVYSFLTLCVLTDLSVNKAAKLCRKLSKIRYLECFCFSSDSVNVSILEIT